MSPPLKTSTPQPKINYGVNETKEKRILPKAFPPLTSTSAMSGSFKRGLKRRQSIFLPQAHPFSKIRLQRPHIPYASSIRQRDPTPEVKSEPPDLPLSMEDELYDETCEQNEEDDDTYSEPPNVEELLPMVDDDDLGEEEDDDDDGEDQADRDSDQGNDHYCMRTAYIFHIADLTDT